MNTLATLHALPLGNCLLCGTLATVVGVFVTGDRTFGTPVGKTRMIHYGLCDACMGTGDAPNAEQLERIEKVIRFNLTLAHVATRGDGAR